ncbi:hypothetical protein MPER_09555 [Moniliophthora perniciosa FA553]|nr:hypothetical protein MPER_09555 [Moniliophthora perniciosa FA553]
MTPKQKVTIRLYRPSDCAAVQNLFKTCIVYGGLHLQYGKSTQAHFSPITMQDFCNLSAGLLFFGSLAYLGVLLHGRAALYVNFAYSSVKADLSRVVDHYELKYSAKEDGYTTTGPKGFWVAELVPPHNDGNAEIVGYVALDVYAWNLFRRVLEIRVWHWRDAKNGGIA